MRKRTVLEMGRLSTEAFKQTAKIPLVVVLDNVRSMHNVGAVFRTADAFRVQALCLCGISSQPPHPDIHKTALGAEDSVDWYYEADACQAVQKLKQQGYVVMAVEQAENSVMLNDLHLDSSRKYALVLGHEVNGVQQAVVDLCNSCIEIPQYGTKHSLNVSVAAGMVMWECAKQLLPSLSL